MLRNLKFEAKIIYFLRIHHFFIKSQNLFKHCNKVLIQTSFSNHDKKAYFSHSVLIAIWD